MEKHYRILGYLFLVYGIIALAVTPLILLLNGVWRAGANFPHPIGVIGTGIAVIFGIIFSVIVAILYFVTAYALLTMRDWARVITIIASIVALFSFPLGTALGIYGLWVMFTQGAHPIHHYDQPAPG